MKFLNSGGKEADWPANERHPWYGPCDGFDDGQCAECLQTIQALIDEVDRMRELLGSGVVER